MSVSAGAWKCQIVASPAAPTRSPSSAPPPSWQLFATGTYGPAFHPEIEPLSHERTTYVPARAGGTKTTRARTRAARRLGSERMTAIAGHRDFSPPANDQVARPHSRRRERRG